MKQTDPADSIAASYTIDMAEQIDTLEDRVKERLARLKAMNGGQNLDELAKLTAQVVEETIKHEGDSQLLRTKRDDTLDEALLAMASNRSPDSLTAIAKRYINPTTGRPYTRAALSARLSELAFPLAGSIYSSIKRPFISVFCHTFIFLILRIPPSSILRHPYPSDFQNSLA